MSNKKPEIERYSNLRGVSIEEVIKVSVNEGEGIEDDPIRRVVYWYTKDGTLIGHDDPEIRNFVPRTKEEHHD